MNPTNLNKNESTPKDPSLPESPNDLINFKIWELIFNVYKIKGNLTEKRRNFLWLIQAALLYGYFGINNIDKYRWIIIVFGIIVSLGMKKILKRDSEYHLMYEEKLRDIESKINTKNKIGKFEVFLFDREVFYKNNRKFLKFDLDKYWALDNILSKLSSVRIWENWLFPWLFIIFWFVILIYYLKSPVGWLQAPTINC